MLVGAVAAASGAAIIGRLWELQIVRSSEYVVRAEANRTRQEVVSPVRGLVFARNRTQLVRNIPIFDVCVMPGDIPKDQLANIAAMLAELTNENGSELETAIRLGQGRPLDPIRIIRDVGRETALIIKEKTLDFPGITINR